MAHSTNVFGPLNVNRAFLPYMRERKSGTVVWLGSIAAYECVVIFANVEEEPAVDLLRQRHAWSRLVLRLEVRCSL